MGQPASPPHQELDPKSGAPLPLPHPLPRLGLRSASLPAPAAPERSPAAQRGERRAVGGHGRCRGPVRASV